MTKRLLATLMALAVATLCVTTVAQAADESPAVKPKEMAIDCGKDVSMKLVLIPAGEFMMGSPEKEDGRDAGEGPQHRVKITKPFCMGAYLVTQAQYEAVMGANPAKFQGDKNPVEQVSWDDAADFCRKLSEKSGMTIRLPTEAEWEYACRAGTTTPFNTGKTIWTDQANYNGDYPYGSGRKGENRGKTTAVGSFAANGFGLFDMHGNVMEWCRDQYDAGYYQNSPTDDPPGPEKGQGRVLRGGCWVNVPADCRSASRCRYDASFRSGLIGFRVVCEPKPALLLPATPAPAAPAQPAPAKT